jgi:serine/threonine protein kinase
MMKTINLQDFYKKISKENFVEKVYLKNPNIKDGLFEILKTLGEGSESYHFLASDKKKLVALSMSYEKEDSEKKLRTVKMEMGNEYKKYLLELIEPSKPIKYLSIGEEKLFFDMDVFISVWEPADSTLQDKLEESYENKMKWFIQFLKGLCIIHSRDRIHFDIKLGNLFLVDNQLKIGDFEFYLKREEFFKKRPHICGTPGHIAPELFYDQQSVSSKCDIFSAGVAFCELFTGSKPPKNLIQRNNVLSDEEQDEVRSLFGDKPLTIRDKDIFELFIKNFRIFNFFKYQLLKKLETGKISEKERIICELLLNMAEIDPTARYDVNRLLYKTQEVEFDPESLVGAKLQHRYIIQELLDEGGRGIVYKVFDRTEGLVKAIKLFPPQFNFIKDGFDQIKSELLNTRNIKHRNVVDFYGLEMDREFNFILMEYIEGFNLKEKLDAAKGKKLKEIEALSIMKQVASGLIEAHNNGVIHRNLKYKSIMIRVNDNRVKIINFGLSLKIKKSIADTTGEGPMGSSTLLVAPPEQFQEIINEENEQTDVWGFGVILYQLLTGKIPSQMDLEKMKENHFPVAGISEKTKAVIMKCLEKDRLKRYRNMVDVYYDLFGDYTDSGTPVEIERDSGFFQLFKKKWVLGLIFGLITAVIFVILGTSIIGGGERYKMLYSGKPGDAGTPGGGIGYAVSSNGINWRRYKENPVIPPGKKGSFNEFQSGQPFLVHDGTYFHMLFSGSIKKVEGLEYQIGYSCAVELDQLKKYGSEKMILDNGKIKIPGPMLYMDGYYKMWYPVNGDIYYACTTAKDQSIRDMVMYSDSPVLSKGNKDQWDQDAVITGSILYESGIYRMWYTGKSGKESKIGLSISLDGITWNKYKDNPVFDDMDVTLEMNPCVIQDSKGYKMYYTAAKTGIGYYPVRMATSSDGINWEKYSNNPVFDTGSDEWEKSKIFVTFVTVEKK